MNCSNCQSPLTPNAPFCGSCGAQITWQQPVQQQPVTSQTGFTPAPQPTQTPQQPQMPAPQQFQQPQPQQSPIAPQQQFAQQPMTAQPYNPQQYGAAMTDVSRIKGIKPAAITAIVLGVLNMLLGLVIATSDKVAEDDKSVGYLVMVFALLFLSVGIAILLSKKLETTTILLYVLAGVTGILVTISIFSGGAGLLNILLLLLIGNALNNIRALKSGR